MHTLSHIWVELFLYAVLFTYVGGWASERSCDIGKGSSGESNKYLNVLKIVCWNKRRFQGWEFQLYVSTMPLISIFSFLLSVTTTSLGSGLITSCFVA